MLSSYTSIEAEELRATVLFGRPIPCHITLIWSLLLGCGLTLVTISLMRYPTEDRPGWLTSSSQVLSNELGAYCHTVLPSIVAKLLTAGRIFDGTVVCSDTHCLPAYIQYATVFGIIFVPLSKSLVLESRLSSGTNASLK